MAVKLCYHVAGTCLVLQYLQAEQFTKVFLTLHVFLSIAEAAVATAMPGSDFLDAVWVVFFGLSEAFPKG